MASIQNFQELDIWQQAQQLAVEIYILADKNEKINKDFSFKDQIKRATLSISNNIAEGFEYNNNKDFIKFLRYSKGSTGEVKNCLLFAANVKFVQLEHIEPLINATTELGRKIGALMKYLQRSTANSGRTRNQ